VTITIDGPLKETAHHGREGLDDWVVVLHIAAGRFQHPFGVRVPCGSGPAAAIRAEQLAEGLKAGQMARAVGQRLEFVTDHGFARFALRDCSGVTVDGRTLL
jgi:hypothetical protein